jgi:hypothetical protein
MHGSIARTIEIILKEIIQILKSQQSKTKKGNGITPIFLSKDKFYFINVS